MKKTKNLAYAELTGAFGTSATQFTVATGWGAKFPTPESGAPLLVEIYNATDYPDPSLIPPAVTDQYELVLVGARSSDTFSTLTREQEGTSKINIISGKKYVVRCGFTAGMHNELAEKSPNIQVFTASGTFTVPFGVTRVMVEVVGGGGTGGTANSFASGGGGGAGGYCKKVVTGLTAGSQITVTVGDAGQSSSFGAYCSATNGGNGAARTPGSGGAGTGGDLNLTGSKGQAAGESNSSYVDRNPGGNGGPGYMGNGAGSGGYNMQNNCTAGSANTGAGGGGGCNGSSAGASGGSGLVIVYY